MIQNKIIICCHSGLDMLEELSQDKKSATRAFSFFIMFKNQTNHYPELMHKNKEIKIKTIARMHFRWDDLNNGEEGHSEGWGGLDKGRSSS